MTWIQFIILMVAVAFAIVSWRLLFAVGIIAMVFMAYGLAWIILTPFVWIEQKIGRKV